MTPKRKETSEAPRVQVITLQEEAYNFLTITERTGIPKSTCYDIVKRDCECREPDSKTPYTATAARSECPEWLTHREH